MTSWPTTPSSTSRRCTASTTSSTTAGSTRPATRAPPSGVVLWQHTHGLAELGGFDIDLVAPDRDFANTDSEICGPSRRRSSPATSARARATSRSGSRRRRARRPRTSSARPTRRSPPSATRPTTGIAGRSCANRRSQAVRLRPGRPARAAWLARRPPPDQFVIYFPTATDLMAERARATVGILRAPAAEFAEFEVVAIVKLGYPTTADGREHLWFTAHAIGARPSTRRSRTRRSRSTCDPASAPNARSTC